LFSYLTYFTSQSYILGQVLFLINYYPNTTTILRSCLPHLSKGQKCILQYNRILTYNQDKLTSSSSLPIWGGGGVGGKNDWVGSSLLPFFCIRLGDSQHTGLFLIIPALPPLFNHPPLSLVLANARVRMREKSIILILTSSLNPS
jgi:hypothetical protein